MPYLAMTDRDEASILREIGAVRFEDLIQGIPGALRDPSVELPGPMGELEIQKHMRALAARNRPAGEKLSFLGGGAYEHFIPTAVAAITGRSEFATAYTPYQAEASQGTLQAIFEFQSLIAELTGMDVSNASHYDGATSLAEAAILALRHTGRSKILIGRSVHPHFREVLRTYLAGAHTEIEEIAFGNGQTLDRSDLQAKLDDRVAAVLLQSPNFFGVVEDFTGIAQAAHAAGALFVHIFNPLSLALFKTPREWGADIAVGEGQPLGIPASFGGPYLGIFATTKALMRKMPGRIAGMTKDTHGKRAFCLTLQAREQHIRREKAYSNICSNQALCALAACVYMTLLGKNGMAEVAKMNRARASCLREKIAKIPGLKVDLGTELFNEFTVRTERNAAELLDALEKKGILGGIALGTFYPDLKDRFLVCATETKTFEELDRFASALRSC